MTAVVTHPADPDKPAVKTCDLCGLNAYTPHNAVFHNRHLTFCCNGCEQVYRLIIESGDYDETCDLRQTSLYQQCLAMGLIAQASDDPLQSTTPNDIPIPATHDDINTTRETAFHVGGMWCSSCAWLIEHAVKRERGVADCRVFFASDIVRVTYKPARTSEEDIAAVIRRLGYTAERYREAIGSQSAAARARRSDFIRAVIAIIFAMNVGMFSLALYVGYSYNLGPNASVILPRWAFILSLPVLWAGIPIFKKAFQAARHGSATMETLVTLGALTAFGYSVWVMAHNGIGVYFDTADMLISLVLIGKHIESGAKGEANSAVSLLYAILPRKALVITSDGREMLVAVDKLGIGDRVLVRPGERIPVDGRIIEGAAAIDESLISGESRPVYKTAGDEVTGATIATDSPITVEVTRVGAESTLAQMIAMVESALATKSPAERLADRISRIFVPLIIFLAVITGLSMVIMHAAPAVILVRVVSVLVIACPCALGIATPLAITTAVGAAASRGVIISNTDILEILPRLSHLMLDKTGTVTEGQFVVREVISYTDTPPQPSLSQEAGVVAADADLKIIASIEALSEHPLAVAIVQHWKSMNPNRTFTAIDPSQFHRHEGGGVSAVIDNRTWFIGNRTLALQFCQPPFQGEARDKVPPTPSPFQGEGWDEVIPSNSPSLARRGLGRGSESAVHEGGLSLNSTGFQPNGLGAASAQGMYAIIANNDLGLPGGEKGTPFLWGREVTSLEFSGLTVLFYGVDNNVNGMIVLGDIPREGALDAVQRLYDLDLTVEMMSGDSPATTNAIAKAVGIRTAIGAMTPAQKIERIQETQHDGGIVGMVGDGINDAPALAQANIGISFGSATEIARRAADITLVSSDLRRLADLFTMARQTNRVIRQNLFWACLYNAVCIPLAVAGYVNPIIAASAMLISSISVVLNSKRLKRNF